MAENRAVVVAVINKKNMFPMTNDKFTNRIWLTVSLLTVGLGFGQTENNEYKKRVLETAEIDYVMSYYTQDGSHASVTGGIGTEKLEDITPTFIIALPLNSDDVLTIDAGISAYSSASSSNLDPFDASGASGGGHDDDDDRAVYAGVSGTPWAASSGASAKDVWSGVTINFSHSSDDRDFSWNAQASFANEYDYTSIGFGGGLSQQFNEKNTSISLTGLVFLDNWNPKYPTEIDSYFEAGSNLNNGFFGPIDILNQSGNIINKNGPNAWQPHVDQLITDTARRTFTGALSFSQILSKNLQLLLSVDLVRQQGWLANPMQRVYFSDKPNFYVGNPSSIPNYTSPKNRDVFQLGDDIERLPSARTKLPFGARLNYYITSSLAVRTYFRYYQDDWGLVSQTASIELPVKFGFGKYTLYPNYRYYTQTAADYFAPYEGHLSTSNFYTSDYDLSAFSSHQIGLGFNYTDVFAKMKFLGFGLKSVDLRYNYYDRSDGLTANITSMGIKFVMD